MLMNPTLSIIIVNWNSGSRLRDCLHSISQSSKEGFHLSKVVVVDNASTDGSIRGLEGIDVPLMLVCNNENRGFSAACNQAAQADHADYLLFLNPDTRLFNDSLTKPLKFLEQTESGGIGILGVQLVNDDGKIEHSCARFPTARRFLYMAFGLDRLFPRAFPGHFMTEWDHKDSREVDQVMGSFFLVRGSVFRILDGFDERFFVYFEEVDFTLRAVHAGFRSYYFSEAVAYHAGGGTSDKVKALRLFHSLRSRIQYSYKHFRCYAALGVVLSTLLIEPIARLAFAAVRFSIEGMTDTIMGYIRLWRVVPRLVLNAGKSAR